MPFVKDRLGEPRVDEHRRRLPLPSVFEGPLEFLKVIDISLLVEDPACPPRAELQPVVLSGNFCIHHIRVSRVAVAESESVDSKVSSSARPRATISPGLYVDADADADAAKASSGGVCVFSSKRPERSLRGCRSVSKSRSVMRP
jgi:hypothetical protein